MDSLEVPKQDLSLAGGMVCEGSPLGGPKVHRISCQLEDEPMIFLVMEVDLKLRWLVNQGSCIYDISRISQTISTRFSLLRNETLFLQTPPNQTTALISSVHFPEENEY